MRLIACGGTDRVGASCYFLETGGRRLLLDCGKGVLGKRTYGPDYTALFGAGLASLAQLDAVFLSHGHYDHIGGLPELAQRCPDTPIFATPLTKKLGRYLMMDRCCGPEEASLERKIAAELERFQALERIQPQNYMRPVNVGPVQATFYEAGHVPGAAMVLVESDEGSFLYTGDFRQADSGLTRGCILPEKVRPDVLLLCGLHAKHPSYRAASGLDGIMWELNEAVRRRCPCLITTRELTKGVEIVSYLVEGMENGSVASAPIFIDDYIWTLNQRLQEAGLSVLGNQCRRFPRSFRRTDISPGVYVGGKRYVPWFQTVLDPKFSLHADYGECAALVRTLRPAKVVLVHSPPDAWDGGSGDTALEADCPASGFLYPEVGRVYDLL